MIWRKFWTLICTLIFLTLIQKSICFRIKYDADVESEASISKTSTIDETKSTLRNFESDRIQDEDSDNILEKETKIKVADSNNIPEKESKSNSNIHPDSSEQKLVPENGESVKLPPETFKGFGRNPAMRKLIESEDPQLYEKLVNLINASQSEETENLALKVSSDPAVGNIQLQKPEPNINIENNFSVKQQPAEVFKGFGRNPAIRKLIENGDPNLYEKFVDYMKTPQPSLAGSVSITHDPESVDSMSDNSNSDNVITKFAQPESIKPLIVTSKTNEKIPDAASISEASVQSIEHKEQNVFINSEKALQQPLEETPKYLNTASLAQITQSSGKGEAQSIECDIPHLDINSRCFANVMEVTVTSRSSLLARISFVEAEGHIDMSGNTVNLYAVYGKKTTQGFMWQLQKGVTVGDVDVSCQNCHTLDLRMMVLVMENFKEKNKRCVVDLTCTQSNMPDQPSLESSQTSQTEIPKDSMITESDGSRVHSAKTTLNILKGTSMESEVLPQDHYAVGLGNKLGLSISAYSKDISLDLHIITCEARGEDGNGITLIKDGCSVHHTIEEFHEVLGMVHDPEVNDDHIVKVTQHTTFEVFNFSPSPQAIAIICKIKMCGGECDEHPGCVNSEVNLGHRKQRTFTVFYEEVVLGQMLNVAGLPEFHEAPQNLDLLSNIIEPEEAVISVMDGKEQNLNLHASCIPRSVFYISLCVLGGLFLLLLVLGLYFSKVIALPRMDSYKHMDEVESPSRALYHEYSSPRRRSPGSKSPNQQSMLSKIVYS